MQSLSPQPKGSILLITLGVLCLISLLGLSLNRLFQQEQQSVITTALGLKAEAYAYSMIDHAMASLYHPLASQSTDEACLSIHQKAANPTAYAATSSSV